MPSKAGTGTTIVATKYSNEIAQLLFYAVGSWGMCLLNFRGMWRMRRIVRQAFCLLVSMFVDRQWESEEIQNERTTHLIAAAGVVCLCGVSGWVLNDRERVRPKLIGFSVAGSSICDWYLHVVYKPRTTGTLRGGPAGVAVVHAVVHCAS